MFSKLIIMKCGHPADCIMHDVPYHDEKWNVAACSSCFDDFGTALQLACCVAEKQPQHEKPLPKIPRNYSAVLIGSIVVLVLFLTIMIASITP